VKFLTTCGVCRVVSSPGGAGGDAVGGSCFGQWEDTHDGLTCRDAFALIDCEHMDDHVQAVEDARRKVGIGLPGESGPVVADVFR